MMIDNQQPPISNQQLQMITIQRLKGIKLFSQLPDEDLARLAALFKEIRLQHGEIVCKQGDPGNAFYVIETGVLRVRHIDRRGHERVLTYLQAPNNFGETSLMTGLARDVSIEVFSKEASLWVLTKSDFDELQNQNPELKDALQIKDEVRQKLSKRMYPWLTEGEIVIVNARRHPATVFFNMVWPTLLSVLFGIIAVAINFLDARTKSAVPYLDDATAVFAALAGLVFAGALVWIVLDWSNDYFIVTTKNIIHIEKVIGFFQQTEQVPLDQVTNVQETVPGFFANILGFSDLRVLTSANYTDIDLTFAPARSNIRARIFEQMGMIQARAAADRREKLRSSIQQDLRERLTPDLNPPPAPSAPAEQPRASTIKRTSLGKRISDLFGLRIIDGTRVTYRKHWTVLLDQTWDPSLVVLMLIFVGLIHLGGIIPIAVPSLFGESGFSILAAVSVLWVFGLGGAIFWLWYQYEDWRNDIYQVTDDRLLDLERSPLRLWERSVETTLERVQNISATKPNFIANLFNFGDLVIETAGAEGRLIFHSIFNPEAARQEIYSRRDKFRASHQAEEAKAQRAQFLDYIYEYDRLMETKSAADQTSQQKVEPLPDSEPEEEEEEE